MDTKKKRKGKKHQQQQLFFKLNGILSKSFCNVQFLDDLLLQETKPQPLMMIPSFISGQIADWFSSSDWQFVCPGSVSVAHALQKERNKLFPLPFSSVWFGNNNNLHKTNKFEWFFFSLLLIASCLVIDAARSKLKFSFSSYSPSKELHSNR